MVVIVGLYGQELTVPGYECSDCHGTGGWDELELSNFDHNKTLFQLKGVHTIANCSDCHRGTTLSEKHRFSNISASCNTCHLDIHKSQLGDQCGGCHTSNTWIVEQQLFNHEETRFSLMGAHRFVDCTFCHDDLTRFDVTPSDCYSCHIDVYDNAENPSHFQARISTDCQECHEINRSSWAPSTFDHNIKTLWPLTGAHFGAECSGCHSGVFEGIPSDCWSCHQQDYEATGSGQYQGAPNHNEKNFNQNCEICHTTIEWLGAEVNHDLTAFPLTGSHITTDCEQCHGVEGNYDLPLTCAGCHTPTGLAQTDYTTSTYDHESHNIAGDCDMCHTTTLWPSSIFSHTSFTSETCIHCHSPEYETSADPPHANNNISPDCEQCHSTDDWQDNSFIHSDAQTGFVLHGLHAPVDCQLCHVNNVYNGISISCESSGCHLSSYESTTDPNHTDYGYPVEYCDECHNEFGWVPIIFSHQLSLACATCHLPDYNGTANPVHDEALGFGTTCENCHTSTNTWVGATFAHTGITNGCNTCHLDDYNNTTDPNHIDLNFSTTCEECHTSFTTWAGATFAHTGITNGCNTCHLDDYNSTTDPNHIDLNFSTTCEDCHTSFTTWEGAVFSHDGITTDCYTCHLDDYNSTTDPNHSLWGYPITCEDCHTSTTDWDNVTFNHSFPIAPNGHQDERAETCFSCHPDGSSDTFTCFGSDCHSVTKMLNEHCEHGPSDCKKCNGLTYPYSGVISEDCIRCHPNGSEDDCGDFRGQMFKKAEKDSWRKLFLPN